MEEQEMERLGLALNRLELDKLLADGKTKKVYSVLGKRDLVVIESKSTLSKGDGEVIAFIAGKDEWATRTTCNAFELLKRRGIKSSFLRRIDGIRFLALRGEMIKYEVVIRGIATRSYCKRNPVIAEGTVFPEPVVEFFLKTTGKKWQVYDSEAEEWRDYDLEVDDPFVVFEDGKAKLYHPRKPMAIQVPMLELDEYPLSDSPGTIIEIIDLALRAFVALREALENLGATIFDLKIEVQLDESGKPMVSDVVDAYFWRVQDKEGKHSDKQPFRDGAPLEEVAETYKRVADLTDQFAAAV